MMRTVHRRLYRCGIYSARKGSREREPQPCGVKKVIGTAIAGMTGEELLHHIAVSVWWESSGKKTKASLSN
jgi:hypothetical protein